LACSPRRPCCGWPFRQESRPISCARRWRRRRGVSEPGLTEFETVAWEGFLAAESSYQRVTDDLLASLEAQRDELAPETIEIVERNLRLIEEASSEARAALQRDPANRRLVGKLTDMYRTRLNFLEGMSRL